MKPIDNIKKDVEDRLWGEVFQRLAPEKHGNQYDAKELESIVEQTPEYYLQNLPSKGGIVTRIINAVKEFVAYYLVGYDARQKICGEVLKQRRQNLLLYVTHELAALGYTPKT